MSVEVFSHCQHCVILLVCTFQDGFCCNFLSWLPWFRNQLLWCILNYSNILFWQSQLHKFSVWLTVNCVETGCKSGSHGMIFLHSNCDTRKDTQSCTDKICCVHEDLHWPPFILQLPEWLNPNMNLINFQFTLLNHSFCPLDLEIAKMYKTPYAYSNWLYHLYCLEVILLCD